MKSPVSEAMIPHNVAFYQITCTSLFTAAAGFDEIGCLGALAWTAVCIGCHKKGMHDFRLSSPYGSLISSNESNNNYNNKMICIILRACTLSHKPGALVSP